MLNESNYFAPENQLIYMGASQFKMFRECELKALAILRGEWAVKPSKDMLIGSYVDAHFSGTLDLFKGKHPEIFRRDGELLSEFKHANYIIDRIERDEEFVRALSGQSQVIMTGTIEGVPVKVKIDSLLPDRTVDLKIMKDLNDVFVEDEGYQPFWKAWGYDIQAAIYQEVRRQNDGALKPFGLAVATKEKEPDIGLFEFPQYILKTALDEVRAYIAYYDGLKKGLYEPEQCGKCDVCRNRKKLKGWTTL